jgi:hypothetical protein
MLDERRRFWLYILSELRLVLPGRLDLLIRHARLFCLKSSVSVTSAVSDSLPLPSQHRHEFGAG